MKALSRRQLLALGAAGLALPRRALAAAEPDHRFVFVYCWGGWDTTFVFTPAFDIAGVSCETDATTAELGGITFVDHAARPQVRSFFEDFADRTCVLNGLEVRSVAHRRCRQILLTGGAGNGDDWASIIAGQRRDLAMPHLVISGPAYNEAITGHVVRVGSDSQLTDLLDGASVSVVDRPVQALEAQLQALQDAHLRARLGAPGDRHADFAGRYAAALDQLDVLAASADQLELSRVDDGCAVPLSSDAATIVSCLAQGLSRCAMVQHDGKCGGNWDTHSSNNLQSDHFEDLFGGLRSLVLGLDGTLGPDGRPLSETTTVVVLSEMGRHPVANTWGGKDHWSWTSAMLVGPKVTGGRVVGRMNDAFGGNPVDLASGELSDSGTTLDAEILGATLLTMAGVDPGEWTDAQPLDGILL